MRSQAIIRAPDGRRVSLGHGDFIGRLWSSALVIDDPRVSEAHALVSVRGHELKLLALRGRFAVDGRPLTELSLRPGQVIELAEGLAIEVEDVELPEEVLGISIDGLPARVLPGTCALVATPTPGLAHPSSPGALAHVWCQPDGWRVRPIGAPAARLEEGTTLTLGGVVWRAERVDVARRAAPTVPDPGLAGPLRLVARYDAVHLHQRGRAPVVLVGQPARLLSELVAFGTPVPWAILCESLWGAEGSRKQLDMALVRLRRKLRDAGLRTDLVRAQGAGVIELYLHDGDEVEDQT